MNNLRTVLASQPKKQKQTGLVIMITGLASFFISMSYFGMFGQRIEYSGKSLSEMAVVFGFLIFGLYGFGYAVGGKRLGFSFAKWWVAFLVMLGILGYLGRQFR